MNEDKDFQLAHKHFELLSALRFANQSPRLDKNEQANIIKEVMTQSEIEDLIKELTQ